MESYHRVSSSVCEDSNLSFKTLLSKRTNVGGWTLHLIPQTSQPIQQPWCVSSTSAAKKININIWQEGEGEKHLVCQKKKKSASSTLPKPERTFVRSQSLAQNQRHKLQPAVVTGCNEVKLSWMWAEKALSRFWLDTDNVQIKSDIWEWWRRHLHAKWNKTGS